MVTSLTDVYGLDRILVNSRGSVEIPDRVIKNPIQARSIYFKLRANHIKRISLYAEIQGMIAGNAPYDVDELRQANLSHIANFNTLEPRALYERNALGYWNLLFTSESVINFTFRYPDPQAQNFADLASKHWDEVVRCGWRSFDINTASLCGQLVKFGISPVIWPDERDPRWRVVELSKFLVPDQSASDLNLLSIACVETEVPIVYLLEILQEYKGRQGDTKWNLDELERLLQWTANSPMKDSSMPHDMTELEQKISQGDISYDRLYNETVRLVSLYYREADDKISHFMFHRHYDNGKFLYLHEKQYNSFDECLLVFTQSPGEQFIHSNRGLGHKIYALCQAKMMMDNSLVDMARWSATPILKSPSMTVKDADQVMFHPGVPTNIGSAEFINNTLGANLQGVITTSQYFSQLLQQNAAFAGDNPGMPDQSIGSLSPTQTRLQAFKEFGVLRNQVNHFYKNYDVILNQMVIKMVHSKKGDPGRELFEEWKERCIDDGMPEELFSASKKGELPPRWGVKATRSAGAGSQVAHLIGLQELSNIVGSFGKREETAYKREWIKATMGTEYVSMFMEDSNETDELGGGASLAGLENAIMQDGKAPLFDLANDHRSHVAVHLALGNDTIQLVTQQQIDVVQADRIFNMVIPHTTEHMKALENSIFAVNFLNQVKAPFEEIVKYAQLNRRNAVRALQSQAEQQQKDQEGTQEVMDDAQRKDFVAQKDSARADFKVQSQVERAKEANQTRAEIMRRKTDEDIRAKQRKTDADVSAKLRTASVSPSPENPSIENTNASEELLDRSANGSPLIIR